MVEEVTSLQAIVRPVNMRLLTHFRATVPGGGGGAECQGGFFSDVTLD